MKGVVRNRLMQYVQNGDIAGGSILVRKGGEIVLEDYIGFSDIERAIPLKEDSVFRLASMTKPVVAAGIILDYGPSYFIGCSCFTVYLCILCV